MELSALGDIGTDVLKLDLCSAEMQNRTNALPGIFVQARTLRLNLLAEGIESAEQLNVLRKAGFNLISDIRDEKAQGLQQKIGDINKKYKLGYEKPSVNDIQAWIDAAANVAVVTEEAE